MGRPRKYFTEEERKKAQRESEKRYRETHKDKIAAKNAGYYQRNKEKIAAQQAEYRQNNKEKFAEYYQNNKEKFAAQNAKRQAEYLVRYRSTPMGRAVQLVSGYKRNDKKYNRGECTLTAAWIVEHIFSQPCHYCGNADWTKLGCDRKDSSLPHIPENCVPCCKHCNDMKGVMSYDDYIKKIKSGGSPTS